MVVRWACQGHHCLVSATNLWGRDKSENASCPVHGTYSTCRAWGEAWYLRGWQLGLQPCVPFPDLNPRQNSLRSYLFNREKSSSPNMRAIFGLALALSTAMVPLVSALGLEAALQELPSCAVCQPPGAIFEAQALMPWVFVCRFLAYLTPSRTLPVRRTKQRLAFAPMGISRTR